MKRRKPPPRDVPRYLAALAQLTGTLKPGTVNHVEVAHDPWCAQMKGTGSCNCNPAVRVVRLS